MKNRILLYGMALALFGVFLNLINYYYLVRLFSAEVYVVIIALLFTGVGVWAGRKLTSRPNETEEFHPNMKAIESLEISERELEVLELIAEGHSNQQIADTLYISINTVKTHVSSLLSKMNVQRRTQAVKKAKTLSLIP